VLILTTIGRKNGQERKTPVTYHRDEDAATQEKRRRGGYS
jgi:hypothetical protein